MSLVYTLVNAGEIEYLLFCEICDGAGRAQSVQRLGYGLDEPGFESR